MTPCKAYRNISSCIFITAFCCVLHLLELDAGNGTAVKVKVLVLRLIEWTACVGVETVC